MAPSPKFRLRTVTKSPAPKSQPSKTSPVETKRAGQRMARRSLTPQLSPLKKTPPSMSKPSPKMKRASPAAKSAMTQISGSLPSSIPMGQQPKSMLLTARLSPRPKSPLSLTFPVGLRMDGHGTERLWKTPRLLLSTITPSSSSRQLQRSPDPVLTRTTKTPMTPRAKSILSPSSTLT